jgi:hypothetical protein
MKNLSWGILLVFIWAFEQGNGYSQSKVNNTPNLARTKETIVKYDFDFPIIKGISSLVHVGYFGESDLYKYDQYSNWSISFYMLNGKTYKFTKVLEGISINGKSLFFFNVVDSLIFYREAFFSSTDDGYNKLVLHKNDKKYILDSIYNSDKKIHSSFSTDGKFLIVNTLNTLSDYYNPNQDDRIMVYSLDSLRKGKISKEYIPCAHCSDCYLVGNDLFFSKSNQRDDFSGGFAWKDIYVSPWGKLQDSNKVAAFTEIIAVSPDGKYILGTRHFDLPNSPCAIIDVEHKKYQLLLGRDYSKAKAFYSNNEKKFAFDFGGKIVYVDFPKEYPFNALRRDNPDIPDWTNNAFYKQFEYEPFDK